MAVLIAGTATRMRIKQTTGHGRMAQTISFRVIYHPQTAFAATVTKGFPFCRAHFSQRLCFPEGGRRVTHNNPPDE